MPNKSHRLMLFLIALYGLIQASPGDQHSLPGEDQFLPIESFTAYPFKIKGFNQDDPTDAIFKYVYKSLEGSIIIQFIKGGSPTSFALIYDSYESISRNHIGKYVGYRTMLQMNQKEYVLREKDYGTSKVLYIILTEINYYTDDLMIIFHENDAMPMKMNIPIEINKFYTSQERLFEFECRRNETVKFEWNAHGNFKGLIELYKNDTLLETFTIEEGSVTLNKEMNYEGKYYGKIKASAGKIQLLVSIKVRTWRELTPMQYYDVSMLKGGKYYFYAPLKDYQQYDEGSITARLTNVVDMKNIIKTFTAVVRNMDDDEDDTLTMNSPMPNDTTSMKFNGERMKDHDAYYDLFFFNSEPHEEGMTPYLLIFIELDFNASKPNQPLTFSLVLSNKPKEIDLTSLSSSVKRINKTIPIEDHIPIYYTIKLPKCGISSIILHNSEPNVQRIFKGRMFTKDHKSLNKKSINDNWLAISKLDIECPTLLTLQITGMKTTVHFTIEITKGEIEALDQLTIDNPLYVEMTDCSIPYYFLDHDSRRSNVHFYGDVQYGEMEMYYKNGFVPDKDNKDYYLFPNKKDKVAQGFGTMDSGMNFIGIKCTKPGLMLLHVLSDMQEMEVNQRVAFLSKSPDSKVMIKPYEGTFGIEVSSLASTVEIYCHFNDEEFSLTDNQRVWKRDNITGNVDTNQVNCYASDAQVVIIIKIGSMTGLVNKEETIVNNTDQHVIFMIEDKSKAEGTDIVFSISNPNDDIEAIHYQVGKGNFPYITLPLLSNTPAVPLTKGNVWTFVLRNPYQIAPINNEGEDDDADESYYIALSFPSANIQSEITINYQNITTDPDPLPEPVGEAKLNQFNIIKPNECFTLAPNDNSSKDLVIIIQRDQCNNGELILRYPDNKEIVLPTKGAFNKYIEKSIEGEIKIYHRVKPNSNDESQPSRGLSFSYNYLMKNQLDGINDITAMNTTLSYEKEQNKLIMSVSPKLPNQKYHIYLFNKTDNTTTLDDDLYLQSSTNKLEITIDNDEYVLPNTLKTGDYYVGVSVVNTEPITTRVPMRPIMVTIVNDFNWMFIWLPFAIIGCLCLIAIVYLLFTRRYVPQKDYNKPLTAIEEYA